MPIINAALGLASFVPGIVRWLSGDKAGDVADKIVSVAKTVTGIDDADMATQQILADPQLQIQFQLAMQPVLIAQYESEAKQLESINTTMRAEYASSRWYVASWRPTFGYIVAITWLLIMVAIAYVMVFKPEQAAATISALSALSFMWTIALTVLGVSVRERSKDKQVAAGLTPGSLLGSVTEKLLK